MGVRKVWKCDKCGREGESVTDRWSVNELPNERQPKDWIFQMDLNSLLCTKCTESYEKHKRKFSYIY